MKDLSKLSSPWGIVLTGLSMVLILLALFFSCDLVAVSPSKQSVGGTCLYKQYKGEAEIISVTQRPDASGEYEIKFSFHPQETIQEDFANVEGKQWLIVQKDSSYPKKDFLTQYGITIGKQVPCYLKVIIKGTCTPLLFDFPTIGNGKAQ